MRILLIALLTLAITSCQKEEKIPQKELVRPVKSMLITDITNIGQRTFPGMAKAANEVNLSFRISGPLVELSVRNGQKVKKGEIIARIDPRDFEVKVRNAEANLERAKANRKFAEKEYNRALKIRAEEFGAASQKMIDKRKQQLDATDAEIKAISASLQAAKDDLSDTYLKAPFDSTVISRFVENFEYVNAKQEVIRLISSDSIDFIINIPGMLIPQLKYVKSVEIEFDAHKGKKLMATVKEVSTEASQITRTFPITLTLPQPEGFTILPGMAGKAIATGQVAKESHKAGISVPAASVISNKDDGKFYVWIVNTETMTVHQREVETGSFGVYGIFIQKGLKPGETLVTAGANYLREGQQVKLLSQDQ